MIFDTINTVPCIPGTGGTGANGSGGSDGGGGGGGSNDPRCTDAAFAASNPDICGTTAYIVLKPASVIIPVLGSVQFNVFLYQNGVETLLTSGLLFGTSDSSILLIGASSGNGTGLAAGEVAVNVSYQGLTASADVLVVDSTLGCSAIRVATAIVIDNSKSMALSFGGAYQTLLVAAKNVATSYAGTILEVGNSPKDSLSVFYFNDAPVQVTSGFSQSTSTLTANIASVTQSQGSTDIASALTAAITALADTTADTQVILLITDGVQTDSPSEQDILNISSAFTDAGGIIICIGIRAAASAFDLLERIATGGFFINMLPSNVTPALGGLSYLKSAICAGACVPAGDYYAATAALDYSSFKNWSVVSGQTNLLGNGFLDLLPGNGLYVQLAAENNAATIETIDAFQLSSGDSYEIKFSLAGNNESYTPSANAAVLAYLTDVDSGLIVYQHVVTADWNSPFLTFALSFTASYSARVRLGFTQQINANYSGDFAGNLLDNITLTDLTAKAILFRDDFDEENVTYVPPACGPSAALAEIDEPGALTLGYLNYANGNQVNAETYKYAVSYKTEQGETGLTAAASTASLTPVVFPMQATLVSGFVVTDENVLQRITSIRVWRNDASVSSTLYLLAEISPESVNYVDLESHADFAGRVDTGIIAPTSNTTAVAAGELGFGTVGCYQPVCEPAVAVGVQSADPNPLPDTESGGGGTGGTTYVSTKQVCASCPSGSIGSLTPVMSSLTTPSGTVSASDGNSNAFFAFDNNFDTDIDPCHGWWKPNMANPWIQYKFGTAQVPIAYCVSALPGSVACSAISPTAFELQGSNDGTAWTTLDTQTGIDFTSNYIQKFSISNSTAYLYLRIMFTAFTGGMGSNVKVPVLEIVFYGTTSSNPICMSATAQSAISQSDADNKASTAASNAVQHALQQVGCIVGYTSTKSFTASCPCGSLGQSVTKSSTQSSTVSQSAADDAALDAAQAAAESALVCIGSNNSQLINIPYGPANAPASVYPSVKFVSGFVGNSANIILTLTGLSVRGFENFDILLRSPTGKVCAIKNHGGETGDIFTNFTLHFADAGATVLPNNAPPVNGTTYKATQQGSPVAFPGCVEAAPYFTTLNALAGESPNGAWSLWIRVVANTAPTSVSSLGGWTLTIT